MTRVHLHRLLLAATLLLLVCAAVAARADPGEQGAPEPRVVSTTRIYLEHPQQPLDLAGARALRLDGPWGPDGPFNEKGPIGKRMKADGDPSAPSTYVHRVVDSLANSESRFLRNYSRWVQNQLGATSHFGPDGPLGPTGLSKSFQSAWQKRSLFGAYDLMGPEGPLGPLGPIGRGEMNQGVQGLPGADGIGPGLLVKDGEAVDEVPIAGKKLSPFQNYSPVMAKKLSRATRRGETQVRVGKRTIDLGVEPPLGTSYMVEGAKLRRRQGRMSDFELTGRTNPRWEVVTFMVSPQRAGDNVGLEVRYLDRDGRERVISSLDGYDGESRRRPGERVREPRGSLVDLIQRYYNAPSFGPFNPASWMSFAAESFGLSPGGATYGQHVNYVKVLFPPNSPYHVRAYSLREPKEVAELPERYEQPFRLFVGSPWSLSGDEVRELYAEELRPRARTRGRRVRGRAGLRLRFAARSQKRERSGPKKTRSKGNDARSKKPAASPKRVKAAAGDESRALLRGKDGAAHRHRARSRARETSSPAARASKRKQSRSPRAKAAR